MNEDIKNKTISIDGKFFLAADGSLIRARGCEVELNRLGVGCGFIEFGTTRDQDGRLLYGCARIDSGVGLDATFDFFLVRIPGYQVESVSVDYADLRDFAIAYGFGPVDGVTSQHYVAVAREAVSRWVRARRDDRVARHLLFQNGMVGR